MDLGGFGDSSEVTFRWATRSPPDDRGIAFTRQRLNKKLGSDIRGVFAWGGHVLAVDDVSGDALTYQATLTVAGFSPDELVDVYLDYPLYGELWMRIGQEHADSNGALTYFWVNSSPQRANTLMFKGSQSGAQCTTDGAVGGEIRRRLSSPPPLDPPEAAATEVAAEPLFTG